ncbi:hypothetical protein [Rhodopila globiformis]|uniref:hypothetical protein n=1 Tax=Rhodopila globiformis TaxID=1071 RepID=UPI0011B0C5FA|nr:hypothetical protein [Rhodopila globiformis]
MDEHVGKGGLSLSKLNIGRAGRIRHSANPSVTYFTPKATRSNNCSNCAPAPHAVMAGADRPSTPLERSAPQGVDGGPAATMTMIGRCAGCDGGGYCRASPSAANPTFAVTHPG